jgi:hypothetical protein
MHHLVYAIAVIYDGCCLVPGCRGTGHWQLAIAMAIAIAMPMPMSERRRWVFFVYEVFGVFFPKVFFWCF